MIFFAVLMCVDVFIYGIIKIRAIINNKTQMTINHKKIITTCIHTAIYKCMYINSNGSIYAYAREWTAFEPNLNFVFKISLLDAYRLGI